MLVVAAPSWPIPKPVVTRFKNYIENGGRGLIMLDETLRIGRAEPPAENAALEKLLADWGVTREQGPGARFERMGQIFGFGPEVPVVLQYESHPITQPLTRVPTAYPLVRSLDIKNGDRTSVSKSCPPACCRRIRR